MKPCIGIDVSKGESHVQGFLNKRKPFGTAVKITHSKTGFKAFKNFIQELEIQAETSPAFILESTGHYHIPVVTFLENEGYEVIVINPYISSQTRKSALRSAKTDMLDAYHLGSLYYREEFDQFKRQNEKTNELRHLTRQRASLNGMMTQVKLQLRSSIDQLFPTYPKLFNELYSNVSLCVIEAFPSTKKVLAHSIDDLILVVYEAIRPVRSLKWAEKKATEFLELAKAAPSQPENEGLCFNLRLQINLLKQKKSIWRVSIPKLNALQAH